MTPGEELGGYRIVRILGAGSRSTVYLGHGGETRTAALKVYHSTTAPGSIDDEIAALSNATHAHVVQVRDVGSARSGLPFLALERLAHGSLGQLLAARTSLAAGEAVTVLAPIAAAVGALHASGVAHGSLSASTVLFRESGAPVLIGFGHASLFTPTLTAVQLQSSQPVLEDRVATGRLVRDVLSRVDSAASQSLVQWLGELERDGYPDDFARALEARVFELATAVPVRLAHEPQPRDTRMPQRLHQAEPVGITPEPAPAGLLDRARSLVLARVPGLRLPAVSIAGLKSVRKPVWVAAGLGIGSLVAAMILVPPTESGEAVSGPTPVPTAMVEGAVGSDDPVAALSVLLDTRADCLRELSILCLENTAQSGSAALDDDVALIRSIESGDMTGVVSELEPGSVVLTERHGDAALVSYQTAPNSEPASVLLVKGEAGWRIRDYVDVA